ncbi:uracil-DNA glycosylase [Caloramator proteoclasticus]|uniref:Type-4 uracil-DNA glycosylase n=1 Tax=Caloramator proteoclasticus DSM 10124 TaxID=1121262 RepID=A0A1M5BUM9_9CLOT|nr:uracil-DNA glycosylase [Caloramator proteoclasticus]SHF46155.1 DNA polymerase [Caloramator proteoclasticus DSM 10124]
MSNIDELKLYVNNCNRCRLSQRRKNVVFGEGNLNAKLMLIGEGPGEEEDNTGRPFVGKAGKLLDKMLETINIKREEVYIANIVKCRPPNNRIPFEDEARSCIVYLRKQVAIVKPKIIVCLGSTAARYVINENIKITKDRGIWYKKGDFYIIATFHPAALLRDENKKKLAWEDLKKIKAMYETLS